MEELLNISHDAVKLARKAGADHADAVVIANTEISYGQRLGRVETMEESKGCKLGLRVIIGGRQAIVSSSDIDGKTISLLADRAISMAKVVPEELACVPADQTEIMQKIPSNDALDIWDDTELSMQQLVALADEAEQAALAVVGIENSEGANASLSRLHMALSISNGFDAITRKTQFGMSASMIAGQGDAMQTDYDYTIATHLKDLKSPSVVGEKAAMRSLAKVGARQGISIQAPVVFAPRVGSSLLGNFLGGINGDAISKGTSFLQEKRHQQIFSPEMNIIEDPLLPRSLGAKFFDGEGIATQKRYWIEHGILTNWLLDLRSARKLNLQSTGNAGRGISSPPLPSVSNVYVEAGKLSEAELIKDIAQGFYVTSMMGMGVNLLTGDYSQGAEGFWIEAGELSYPVQEMTIASNLLDMFATMAVADNLEFTQKINVPTLRIEAMTITGT